MASQTRRASRAPDPPSRRRAPAHTPRERTRREVAKSNCNAFFKFWGVYRRGERGAPRSAVRRTRHSPLPAHPRHSHPQTFVSPNPTAPPQDSLTERRCNAGDGDEHAREGDRRHSCCIRLVHRIRASSHHRRRSGDCPLASSLAHLATAISTTSSAATIVATPGLPPSLPNAFVGAARSFCAPLP